MSENKKNNLKDKQKLNIDLKDSKELLGLVVKNKRYILAGILLVIFFVLVGFTGGKGQSFRKNNEVTAEKEKGFHKNKDKKVAKLIADYYKAYAKGTLEKLSAVAAPISENEVAYIELFASFIDKIDVKNIYVKNGLDENSLMVSVEMDILFKDVKTAAPGLDFFYVTGVKSGEMYIVNLYSQFNSRTMEYATDEAIEKLILEYENEEEVRNLQTSIQQKYEEAIINDEALDDMVNGTIEEAVSEWMAGITLVQNQTPPQFALGEIASSKPADSEDDSKDDSKDEENNDNKEPEDDKDNQQEVKKVTVNEIVETKDLVNLRKGASTNTDSLGRLEKGVKVTVIKLDTWGEWTYVKTKSGKKGYIRNDFLKTLDSEHTVAGKDGYPDKGDKLKLKEATNLLNKMKKSATVISALSEGTKVKVITCYENGYSKVECNGRTGYVLTANLILKD